MNVLTADRGYTACGLFCVPIPARCKATTVKGWAKLRLTESDLQVAFRGDGNTCILLGEYSGWSARNDDLLNRSLNCSTAERGIQWRLLP